jgi:hypothetical protein
MLGLAPVVAKAAPLLKFIPEPPVQATIGQYYDFATFSTLLDETAIDPIVEATALELGKRWAFSYEVLMAEAFAGG